MRILAMALGFGLAAGAAEAATFTFSFYNWANGGGDVTGIVRGLDDNATSAASSVEILSNTAGFGLGEYAGFGENWWEVKNGKLLSFWFDSFTDHGSMVLARSLHNGVYYVTEVGLSASPLGASSTDGIVTKIKFSPELGIVPLPASLPLLAGALLMLRYRRRLCR